MIKIERFPETAVFTSSCLDEKYIFKIQAESVFHKIQFAMDSFSKKDLAYYNNTIGVIGGRGSGKTSLVESINKTIEKNNCSIPNEQGYFIKPISKLIDPKVLPDNISIVNYVLSLLFIDFQEIAKGRDEKEVNSVFEQFDSLNAAIALLSRVVRQDIIENPSDLYDIGKIINIKTDLENLIGNLLSFHSKDENTKKAFLICVDDFDLDSTNIHRMVLDIMSFLTIKGLIIITSFDGEVFSDEIERQRIKYITDYGPNYSLLRLDTPRVSSSVMARINEISGKAKKYVSQIYTKFIPQSFRVNMLPNITYRDENLSTLLNELCDYLFGFSPKEKLKETEFTLGLQMYQTILSFCERFCRSLANTTDLRVRNQLLNQIIDAGLSSKNLHLYGLNSILCNCIMELSKIVDSSDDRALLSKIGKQLFDQKFASNDEGELVKNYIVYDNGDGKLVRAQELAPLYWSKHPCASVLFEEIINDISYDEQYPYKLVALFELLRREQIPMISDNGRIYARIGEDRYYTDLFILPVVNINGKAIARGIQQYIASGKAISKKQVDSYISVLREYNYSLDEEDSVISRYLDELIELSSKPWRGGEIREYRSDASHILSLCARRLQR